MKKLGLALGGGGARGLAHIGVIRALEEAKIPLHSIAGTSIGALVGGVYAAGHLDELEAFFKTMNWTKLVRQFDLSLRGNGIFKGEKIKKVLDELMKQKTFKDGRIPFAAVATNLLDGKEVILKEGNLASAIRASIGLPGAFTTIKKGGQILLDGGIANPLPINVTRKLGVEVVLAVDLSFKYVYEKKSQENSKRWFGTSQPSTIEVIESSIFLMQKAVTEKNLQKYPADLLLKLDLSKAGLIDFKKAETLIEVGYLATKKIIPKIKKLLK